MASALPQIKKIVWLMLENRSLDHMLGWLYQTNKKRVQLPPDRVFPQGSSQFFDGINAKCVNYVDATPYAPAYGTQDRYQPMRTPRYNPNEWWENVTNQMYWNGYEQTPIPPWSNGKPPMTGFARDYYKLLYDTVDEVMGAYTKDQLPVLYGLAEAFAVSDRWFSSVPTETNPNRAFSVCGTSLGAVDNKDIEKYDTPTLFNVLSEKSDKTWGVYYQYNGFWDMDPIWFGTCYTVDIFPHIHEAVQAGDGHAGSLKKFRELLASDDLPDLCYIEPFWGGGYGAPTGFVGLQGNDYHSPAWVGQAEWDLNELYNDLVNSKYWNDMLFIITFDEHGGTYDHVPPPRTVKPDAVPSIRDFDFTWMGPRVPTILVSPYVTPGMVFRAPTGSTYDFEHTSFIATILKWAGIDPQTAKLGNRVAVAPTFDTVLTASRSSLATPKFTVPKQYKTMGGKKGPHNIPFDIGEMHVLTFQRLLDESTSVEDFLERLRLE